MMWNDHDFLSDDMMSKNWNGIIIYFSLMVASLWDCELASRGGKWFKSTMPLCLSLFRTGSL